MLQLFFMKIVFVSYDYQPHFESNEAWIKKIWRFARLMELLIRQAEVIYIRNANISGHYMQNGVQYIYQKNVKKKSYFPFRLHNEIKKLKPDVVVVVGLRSPLQILQLRWTLGQQTVILARHHADRAPKGLRKQLQQLADKCIDGYLFTSRGNAKEWMDARIISNEKKIWEIPAASTDFYRLNKEQCRQRLGIGSGLHYIWVGRLDENKDPVTMLNGFEKWLVKSPGVKLHIIYQEEGLLPAVKIKLAESELLQKAVLLHGYIPYNELPVWYSAADFFISGSHREGGSYALLEAMACGCIPIVTAIAPAIKVTGNGKYAFYFQAGNANELFEKLLESSTINKEEFSNAVEQYFKKELTPAAIADQLLGICATLVTK